MGCGQSRGCSWLGHVGPGTSFIAMNGLWGRRARGKERPGQARDFFHRDEWVVGGCSCNFSGVSQPIPGTSFIAMNGLWAGSGVASWFSPNNPGTSFIAMNGLWGCQDDDLSGPRDGVIGDE